MHHISKVTKKSHRTVSIDTEKSCDKIQQLLLIIPLSKLGIEGNVINLIKAISATLPANIILHGESPNAFPIRSVTSQGESAPW